MMKKDKKLKTLPAVGAKASNAEFKQMKKQLCLQIDAGQSMRGKAFSKQMNKKTVQFRKGSAPFLCIKLV